MISLALTRGLADTRLTPYQRLALGHLHGELNWSDFRPIKVANVQLGIACRKTVAFDALVSLERLGYIEAEPGSSRPKRYRLRNAECPPTRTSRAA